MKKMNENLIRLGWTFALSSLVLFSACDDDDDDVDVADDPVLAAPTIAVVADNSTPFQGDMVTFTVNVGAEGNLGNVSLDGTSIKSYTEDMTSDEFTQEVTIAEDAETGPVAFVFTVTDKQDSVLSAEFTVSITIQNSDLRGTPVVVTDFQSDAGYEAITFDTGAETWEAAYSIDPMAADPTNDANTVLQANRLGAIEWRYQGGGAVFLQTSTFLSEDDIIALTDGSRVLQMNLYFEEVAREIEAHTDPTDVDNNRVTADASYTFAALDAANYTIDGVAEKSKFMAWNFDAQDSVVGLSIRVEIGNQASWDWNNGDPLGKKIFLAGSITAANEWQTVTFSPLYNAGTAEEVDLQPRTTGDTNSTFVDDTAVGDDQVDYFAMVLNNRTTSFPHPDGLFEIPGDGNGWSSDRVVNITDNHNTYYVDNIRIIDTDTYDQNPNN